MLDVLLLIVAVALILVGVFQPSKSGGLEAFTGRQDAVFSKSKKTGPEKTLWWVTFGLAVAYFGITILSKIL